jgi:hypothetical protein
LTLAGSSACSGVLDDLARLRDGRDSPVILFGACDRHNLGDLLFPHLVAALLSPRPVIVAGVAERDLTPVGGHAVHALARLATGWQACHGEAAADLVHVGGELLTCSLYEAAVMILTPEAAAGAIARYDRDPRGSQAWAEALLGLRQRVAYLAPKSLFSRPGRFLHCALGGVALPRLPAALRREVVARLAESDGLTVRDHLTQATLAGYGIRAGLAPDLAELTAALFGTRIRRQAGEPARIQERFPEGYAAVQFAAEFGDEATLDVLAAQLDRLATATGLGLVLFRAGVAPWHDDLAVYRRLCHRLRQARSWLFESLDIWDVCALLAHARLYIGSSLHGRIVAGCFGVPGVNLASPHTPGGRAGRTSKQAAYLASWHADAAATVVPCVRLAEAALGALA